MPTRYPNNHPAGAPFEHYGSIQSDQAVQFAGEIVAFARGQVAGRAAVHEAVVRWADEEARRQQGVVALGSFGSYARGTWGVGSDVGLIAIVRSSEHGFESRSVAWDTTALPVPAELLVYTTNEWRRLVARGDRFSRVLTNEVVWVAGSPPAGVGGDGPVGA